VGFIAENSSVYDFLARYEEDKVTYSEIGVGVARISSGGLKSLRV
jgi:hypothetical protein